MSTAPKDQLYVDPAHRVPDEEWAAIVRRAQEIRETESATKTGGASSPAGKIIDLRGRSNKHSGVSGIPTQLLVLHSAECPLRGGYALSLTEWAITSAVVASWQRFIDPFHRVYMIDDNHAAWHASEANPMSIGWEQAGYARFSRAEWTTPDGMLQMESLAYDMAQVALRDGIPPVWLTTDQVTAVTTYGNRSIKGFCLHRQIDPESRTDPGDGYPYDLLMAKIKGYMGAPAKAPQSAPTKTGGLTVADINSITKQLSELLERTKPINTSSGEESLRDFIAKGTRAAQAAAENTAPINVSGGRQEGIRDFIAKGTRAAQAAEARLAALESVLSKALSDPGADLATLTAAAEAGATKALSNLSATVTIEQEPSNG